MVCALLIVGGLYRSGANHVGDTFALCTLCAQDDDQGAARTTAGCHRSPRRRAVTPRSVLKKTTQSPRTVGEVALCGAFRPGTGLAVLHGLRTELRAYPVWDVCAGRSWTEQGGHETVPS